MLASGGIAASMDRQRIVQLLFSAFLAFLAYALYFIVQPFLVPIAWAILLAFLFHPLMQEVDKRVKRRSLSALILTLTVGLVVIVPALFVLSLLANEAQALYW